MPFQRAPRLPFRYRIDAAANGGDILPFAPQGAGPLLPTARHLARESPPDVFAGAPVGLVEGDGGNQAAVAVLPRGAIRHPPPWLASLALRQK